MTMPKRIGLLCLLVLGVWLGACGNTGPLTLPDSLHKHTVWER